MKAVVFALELVAFGHSYKLTGRRFDGAWLPSPPPLARPPPRMLADLIMLTAVEAPFSSRSICITSGFRPFVCGRIVLIVG